MVGIATVLTGKPVSGMPRQYSKAQPSILTAARILLKSFLIVNLSVFMRSPHRSYHTPSRPARW